MHALERLAGAVPPQFREMIRTGATVGDLIAAIEARLRALGDDARHRGECRDLSRWLRALKGEMIDANEAGDAAEGTAGRAAAAAASASASARAAADGAAKAAISDRSRRGARGRALSTVSRKAVELHPDDAPVQIVVSDDGETFAYDILPRESLRRVFASHAARRGTTPDQLAFFVPPLKTVLPHAAPADVGLADADAPALVCVALKRKPPRAPPST